MLFIDLLQLLDWRSLDERFSFQKAIFISSPPKPEFLVNFYPHTWFRVSFLVLKPWILIQGSKKSIFCTTTFDGLLLGVEDTVYVSIEFRHNRK